jgi:hypothetical protein
MNKVLGVHSHTCHRLRSFSLILIRSRSLGQGGLTQTGQILSYLSGLDAWVRDARLRWVDLRDFESVKWYLERGDAFLSLWRLSLSKYQVQPIRSAPKGQTPSGSIRLVQPNMSQNILIILHEEWTFSIVQLTCSKKLSELSALSSQSTL